MRNLHPDSSMVLFYNSPSYWDVWFSVKVILASQNESGIFPLNYIIWNSFRRIDIDCSCGISLVNDLYMSSCFWENFNSD